MNILYYINARTQIILTKSLHLKLEIYGFLRKFWGFLFLVLKKILFYTKFYVILEKFFIYNIQGAIILYLKEM